MIQNSLERLFEGLVRALRDDVAPALEDPYARAQATAAAELLGNLATRVEWRRDHVEETLARVRPVLEQAAARADAAILPRTHALLASDAEDVREAFAALAEVQEWAAPDDPLQVPLRAFLVWQLDDEAARLRTGMYRVRD